uniref:Uncharacterized protein n=1 Tax=Chaetoceros debilis TaxID=122233 RepID=A0A6S8U012_9STRA
MNMQQSTCTDANVLYGPTTLFAGHGVKDKQGDYEQKNCYAIGWCDESTATSNSVSSDSDSQSRRRSRTRTLTRTRRTIIIAGLIPATMSASERVDDKDEGDETSDRCSYSLPRIEEALKILKETIYPCICSGSGCSQSRTDGKGEMKESSHDLCNGIKCDSYDIVQGLKVVATWNWTNNDNDNIQDYDGDSDSNDHDEKIDAKRNKIMPLPRIEYIHIGRQPPKIRFAACGSSSDDTSTTDIISFKPCHVQSLDHYRHVNDTSYCRNFHLFDYGVNGNRDRDGNGQAKKGRQGDFDRTLMRISETETLMHELHQVLRSRNPHQEFSRNADISGENFVSSGDKSKHDAHDVTAPPSSILVFRHWSINARLEPNCQVLSTICAQSSLISMIKCQYHFKMNSKSNVQSMFVPREKRALLHLKRNRQFMAQIIDVTLGVLCGCQLLRKQIRDASISSISQLWTLSHEKLLQKNISWLETFPAGFKLNVPLTKVMGRAILWFTQTYEDFLGGSFSGDAAHWLLGFLGIISIVFGVRTMISFVHDLSKLATIHVYIVARAFRHMFQTQLSLFSSLWLLFRGKKKNILRQRSDTLEYDFMQLFLGMILFAICLFLFTTILVYYTFFTFVHLIVRLCVGALRWAYFFMTYFPFGDIFISLIKPGMFTTQVSFGEINSAKERDGDDCNSGQGYIRARFFLDCYRPNTMAIIVESVSQVMKKAMMS